MYYSFPFSPLLESKLSLKESIVSHIKFLLHIRKGDFKGKEDIECKLWDIDCYPLSKNEEKESLSESVQKKERFLSKNEVKKFLLESICKEERLENPIIRNGEAGIFYDYKEGLLSFTVEGTYLNNQKFIQKFEMRININLK